jgi:hypothetical protein
VTETVLCVDIGSTFTKALLVDLATASVAGTAQRPTFATGDVLDAVEACRAEIAAFDPRAADAEVLACSSAGGGLRVLVVGHEELVTAEAGRRVALSSGAKVVGVVATAGAPYDEVVPRHDVDLVLLTGGTDGGNAAALVDGARAVAASGFTGPVVVAGNVDAHAEVAAVLEGRPYVLAANAVPRIGVLAPDSARAAVREQFLRHVIAGKGLSTHGDELAALVQGPTPDVVLAGVEVLAAGLDEERPGVGDVVVVDVGGATTDVYSVVALDAALRDAPSSLGGSSGTAPVVLSHEVVAPTAATRTVEADLGMRESAGLPGSFVPVTDEEFAADEEIARAAADTAVRRHAGRSRVVLSPEGRVVESTGVDLREVALVIGSGGVLRHGREGVAERVLGGLVAAHHPDGWQLPERARIVVDDQYLLMAVGLLAGRHPDVAHALARSLAGARSRVAP